MTHKLNLLIPITTGLILLTGCFFDEDPSDVITPINSSSSAETSDTSSTGSSTNELSAGESSSEGTTSSTPTTNTDSSTDKDPENSSDTESSSVEENESTDSSTPETVSSDESSSTTAVKDPSGECVEYEEIVCLQEIKGYLNRNDIEENYSGNFHFFQTSNLDTIKKYNCQICSDTIKHTKAKFAFKQDCGGGDWCYDQATVIEKNIADIVTFDETVPEGKPPVFSLNFDIWSNFSDNQLTFEKSIEQINAGQAPRVRLLEITLSNDTEEYVQKFRVYSDTTDGLLDWYPHSKMCIMDECFND